MEKGKEKGNGNTKENHTGYVMTAYEEFRVILTLQLIIALVYLHCIIMYRL